MITPEETEYVVNCLDNWPKQDLQIAYYNLENEPVLWNSFDPDQAENLAKYFANSNPAYKLTIFRGPNADLIAALADIYDFVNNGKYLEFKNSQIKPKGVKKTSK